MGYVACDCETEECVHTEPSGIISDPDTWAWGREYLDRTLHADDPDDVDHLAVADELDEKYDVEPRRRSESERGRAVADASEQGAVTPREFKQETGPADGVAAERADAAAADASSDVAVADGGETVRSMETVVVQRVRATAMRVLGWW